jgi:L-threonylcarbamoyladenylate synthase
MTQSIPNQWVSGNQTALTGKEQKQVEHSAIERSAIDDAAKVLLSGGLVAFPTETVYGLGADAENVEAIQRIYQAKGRPQSHPVIVHVAAQANLQHWAKHLPDEAYSLIEAFWPGPLTLILQRQPSVPAQVSGGQDTIGLRCPAHPVALALIESLAALKPHGQAGIAAPSANLFGHVSPTLQAHVVAEFPTLVAQGMPVLEGGASEVGIESTIIDLSRIQHKQGVFLLRPGGISAQQVQAVLGQVVQGADTQAPRVSGALHAHYAPRTPIRLVDQYSDIEAWLERYPDKKVVFVSHKHDDLNAINNHFKTNRERIMFKLLSENATYYAHDLYATLRAIDALNVAQIFWAAPPQAADWTGVNDRLNRAAAAFERG